MVSCLYFFAFVFFSALNPSPFHFALSHRQKDSPNTISSWQFLDARIWPLGSHSEIWNMREWFCVFWHGCCSLSSHLDVDLTPQIILTWVWKLSKISVLVTVNIAIMKHHYHSKSGWKEFIWLSFPYHYPSSEEVRTVTLRARNLEAGIEAEAMEGCCLLT